VLVVPDCVFSCCQLKGLQAEAVPDSGKVVAVSDIKSYLYQVMDQDHLMQHGLTGATMHNGKRLPRV